MAKHIENISPFLLLFIDKFIAQQEIVLEAMRDTWPHLLIVTEQEGDRAKLHEAVKRRDFIPQSGSWGKNEEWHYFIHGTGCRLVHVETSEPIEWDAPNLQRFDRYWFTNWMEWILTQNGSDDATHTLLSSLSDNKITIQHIVFSSILYLEEIGSIKRDENPYFNKYIRLSS